MGKVVANAARQSCRVVPRAWRRTFANADQRRILHAAELCPEPGNAGARTRREGVLFSSLSSWSHQRDATALELAPTQLHGGAGNDTYLFDASWGHDTIVDSDRQGTIKLGADPLTAVALPGGKQVPGHPNVWVDDAQQYVYTLINGRRIARKRAARPPAWAHPHANATQPRVRA